MVRFFATGLVVILALVCSGRCAAEATPDSPNPLREIKLNSLSYNQADVVGAFLQSTMSADAGRFRNFVPNGYSPDPSKADDFFRPERFKAAYPWLYPLLYENRESPKMLVVNKWVKPLRIGIGLPNDFQTYDGSENPDFGLFIHSSNYTLPEYTKAQGFVEEEAKEIVPHLAQLTGLDIKYVPNVRDNDAASYQNVNIILLKDADENRWSTKFKGGRVLKSGNAGINAHSWHHIEQRLVNAVNFTPNHDDQVDGYFISNAANEIQFAVCYIWIGHEESMLRKLAQECLVRSLGFPGDHSLLWGRESISVLRAWNTERPIEPEDIAKPLSQDANYSTGISETDRRFIRTLYSGLIKPGAEYWDIFNLLSASLKEDGK